ncbi:MAG: hypothetical protein AAGL68_11810 [Pseudomonadota bacterium]
MTQDNSSSSETIAPSTRKSRNLLLIALAIGGALGLFLGLSDGAGNDILFSNAPISQTVALISIAVWLIIVPAISWLWWKSVDEHEANAYREGAMISAHLYLFIVPAWWFAARAGWLQAQDPMIVFMIVCGVWILVWAYRKYA